MRQGLLDGGDLFLLGRKMNAQHPTRNIERPSDVSNQLHLDVGYWMFDVGNSSHQHMAHAGGKYPDEVPQAIAQ